MNSTELGSRIRFYREQYSLSQEALGERIGVSYQQIQKYEKGQTNINLLKLQKLSQVFDIPLALFVEEPEPKLKPRKQELYSKLNSEEWELLQEFRRIEDEKFRKALLRMAKTLY